MTEKKRCPICKTTNIYHRSDCPNNPNLKIKSKEEYTKIWEEMGRPKDFDISDMEYIDRLILSNRVLIYC